MIGMIRWRLLVMVLTVVGLGALGVGFGTDAADAAAGDGPWIEHPGLVPENPQRNYPATLTTPFNNGSPRQTYAIDMIGPYIVSGGDFQQIRLPNGGPTVTQPHLAVYDSRNRTLVCQNLDVDDEVLSIAPGPRANTAVIGGRFDKVNGSDGVERTRNKIALIDLEQCSVDRTWIVSGLNGRVTELAVSGNRLFVAGDFTGVEGTGIGNLFEVSLDTANLNTSFDPNFGGAESRAVVGMEASPNGNRLAIVHRATSIMGVSMRGTAIFNIANPGNITLTAHRMHPDAGIGDGEGRVYDRYDRIQDGTISPDFSTIVIAQGPGDAQDYVTAIPTVEQVTDEKWQLYMRDTTFSAAATNDAVYVAGHFCRIDRGPGNGPILGPNGGPNVCDGLDEPDGAFRTQIAALDLDDGTPLAWNPGINALVGGRALAIVDRGLLVGFDGDRSNDVFVGTTAFFDFGAPPDPGDPRDDLLCTATVNGGEVALNWNRVGNITSYIVRRNSSWIASPGNAVSYTDAPPAGTHTYYIRTRLGDDVRDVACAPTVTVAAQGQTCTAVLRNDGTIRLDWDPIAGEDFYNVRRNGGWVANATGGTTFFVDDPGSGVFTYVIRSRRGAVTTNTTCNPQSIAVAGGPAQSCTGVIRNNGTLRFDWDAIAGEDRYIVRRNDSWIATVDNSLFFVVRDHSPGDTYQIRSSKAGVQTDTTCTI